MVDSLALLDQALTLGEGELNALAEGDVDTADTSAQERGRLIALAWEKRDSVREDELREKLLQLQTLQGRLTSEARKLHQSLREELQRSRKESTRLSGYRRAVSVRPLQSHYISKHG
ncbi:hypothetical protein [Oleidesulfovibrio sp.]|uniref:hypothetical protein n=1 Tax=Oleidesulfovibrio sp. TaxID=2909707 RepID=UPI003A83EDF6